MQNGCAIGARLKSGRQIIKSIFVLATDVLLFAVPGALELLNVRIHRPKEYCLMLEGTLKRGSPVKVVPNQTPLVFLLHRVAPISP